MGYRLLYRRIDMKSGTRIKVDAGSDWTNVIIPGDDHKYYSSKQTMRWRLDNLFPDTTYECLVQARNKYGWSQASRMFTFQTVLHTVKSAATQGLNWTTSGCGHYAGVTIVTLATSLVSSLASRKLAA